MKNTFGSAVSVTLYGESHGPALGVILDGLAPGIPVSDEAIAQALTLRRPADLLSTTRREADEYTIDSGVYKGKTTGTPIHIRIPNQAQQSGDYAFYGKARPGHADYTAYCKYHGFEDPRGGGHFSGRITAGLVAAGAIAATALKGRRIRIGTHMKACAGIRDRAFGNLTADLELLSRKPFPVLDEASEEQMKSAILSARAEGDSVGGILETAVTGFPAGVGEPWFDSVESILSHLLFSIPAVKGVEFGDGFAASEEKGSTVNDPMTYEEGEVVTRTNHNGGINGGISNGMPLLFRCAIKPTPTIAKPQETVDFRTGKTVSFLPGGRHDPCVAHRARAVVDAVTALGLCDLLTQRFGTDWLGGGEWNTD